MYTVAGGKNLPSWLSDAKKASLRKDEDFRRRVELVQDFEFPAACQRIKVSPDGQYIFASGYHPPRVRAGRGGAAAAGAVLSAGGGAGQSLCALHPLSPLHSANPPLPSRPPPSAVPRL